MNRNANNPVRHVLPDAAPKPYNFSRCTVLNEHGEPCGRDAIRDCSLSVCGRHGLELYRYMETILATFATEAAVRMNTIATQWSTHRVGTSMRDWLDVVYYLEINGQIKIGTTGCTRERFRVYPPSHRVLAMEPGSLDVEAFRLRQFSHLLAGRREWFRPGSDLLDHIEAVAERGLPMAPAPGTHCDPDHPLFVA